MDRYRVHCVEVVYMPHGVSVVEYIPSHNLTLQ
jgi:hypothetical protein